MFGAIEKVNNMLNVFRNGKLVNAKDELFFFRKQIGEEWIYFGALQQAKANHIVNFYAFASRHEMDSLEEVMSSTFPIAHALVYVENFVSEAVRLITETGASSYIEDLSANDLRKMLEVIEVQKLSAIKYGI